MEIKTTAKFRKDLKQAKKKGLNMALLQKVVDDLAAGKKLDDRHHDHALVGDWVTFRECHIQPDWLLIYKISDHRHPIRKPRVPTKAPEIRNHRPTVYESRIFMTYQKLAVYIPNPCIESQISPFVFIYRP